MGENKKSESTRDLSQVQVLNRAISILRVLRDTGGLNLSRLAAEVGLARTTVHRIVSTLEAENLVTTATPDGRIQLGIELISLGVAVNSDLRRELRPYLEGLSIEADETVDLAILDRDRLIFIDQVARPRRLRAVSGTGMAFPLHCTANGKAMLATMSEDQLNSLVPEKLQEFTTNTIQTRESLMQELEKVRAMGVALDCEEHTQGICAIGAVVHGPFGKLAAISIPVPSVRFYGNEDKLISLLKQTSETINLRFEGM
jgi:DNA-binding IclR family transcriptional regulator